VGEIFSPSFSTFVNKSTSEIEMSNDSFTEVTSQSWFSRLGNALKGIIFGLILVAVSGSIQPIRENWCI
jgi:hypothetical protein